MAYAPQHPGAESLKKPFFWSLVFHGLLFGSLTVSTIFSHSGDMWGSAGGGEGAVSVGLVAKLPGIMLPRPDVVTQSQVVDTTKGLYKAEPPKPQPKEIEPDVKKIPEFAKEKTPKIISRPSKVFEDKTPPPTNAVPYGQGGSPALPYSSFAPNNGPARRGRGVQRLRPRRWRFLRQISFVRGCRAKPDKQQLVAIHSRPDRAVGAASQFYVSSFEGRNGNKRPDDAIQRQQFGRQVGFACDSELKSRVATAVGLSRDQRNRRVLFRF